MLLLLDQSSTHSLILKLREETIKKGEIKNSNKEEMVFQGMKAFDVFDEVDALMTPKKSFIYSVGSWDSLD